MGEGETAKENKLEKMKAYFWTQVSGCMGFGVGAGIDCEEETFGAAESVFNTWL